jgi:hypothetical protein
MKRSKKPLTFTAIAAGIGALSIAVEGCVYGPPQEVNVYGPPPSDVTTSAEVTDETDTTVSEKDPDNSNPEEVVYGPPSDTTVDNNEVDVYGPPPEDIND